MKATRILHQRAFPRDGHREEKRIEPRVVEPLTDVTARRNEKSRLSVWDGREARRHGASLGRGHPAAEDDDVAGGALKTGGKELEMVLALGEQDGRTSRCQRGPHVVQDHTVATLIRRQFAVERLDALHGHRAISAKSSLANDQPVFEGPAGGLAPHIDGEAHRSKLHPDDWVKAISSVWRGGQA